MIYGKYFNIDEVISFMNKNKITARKELYDHLKYLVGDEMKQIFMN